MRELAQRSPCREVLHAQGLDDAMLAQAAAQLQTELASEPADWHLRLAQRGASSSDLEQLLAIVRSAESHGYQLLERLGISCSALRRTIIEHLRLHGGMGRTPTRPRRASRAESPSRSAAPRNRSVRRQRPAVTSVDEPQSFPSDAAPPEADGGPSPEIGGHPSPAPASPSSGSPDSQPASQPASQTASQTASTPATLTSVNRRALPRLHGREDLLATLADSLGRRAARPPVLVGPPGSGRSLVARHLARVLSAPVFVLDATAYDDEQALGLDLEAVARAKGVVILDDLDRVPSDAAPPFVAALARAWSRQQPPVLTIASPETYARIDLWLPGGAGTFDRIALPPLPRREMGNALAAAAPAVLDAHGVELCADSKLGELWRLADRYLAGLAMPGRALDLLDLSCARVARSGGTTVSREVWLDVVSERSGLPRARIEAQGDQLLLQLEQRLAARVVGHGHVTQTLSQLIRRNRAGFGSQRPVLSTLLLGPSGVGKTEIAKALGQALYERDDALVRLDMSEYSEPHSVARVIGAPPGYVGHEHGGALTDPLRQRPHCVVLLDEIEKAHREVHQLLLQVLDEGRITDGRGRVVELHHAVVVMTSNLGADRLRDDGTLDEPRVLEAARRAFPVELWNRIEAPLVLQPLSFDHMLTICRRLARDSSERLFSERGIRYALSDDACEHLVRLSGHDPALGARPLRHLLTREVESVVADAVLRGRLRAGTQAEVGLRGGRLILR